MTCGTCKHWSKNTVDLIGFACHKDDDSIGICDRAYPDHTEDDKYLLVATCQSEGIYGSLVTKENFGCIEYQAK